MSAADPLISVLTPTYNGAALIRETLDSLFAQTVSDFEVLIVDDGSRDETVAVVESVRDPRVRLFRAPSNGGPAVARCQAMAEARGRYIVGLDQDDLCVPTRFAQQLAFLDAHPDHVLVTSTIAPFGEGAKRGEMNPDLVDPARIDWAMLIANPLAWSSVMMRGGAARVLMPFQRDEYRFAEDFDTYHRLRRYGRIGRIAEPLVAYRHHPGSTSRVNEEKMIRAAAGVLAERYGTLFDGGEGEAALLMSRHVAAGYPPPDAATLAACGRVLARLVETEGAAIPDHAAASASGYWWRIATAGLRSGAYGLRALAAARPAFARDGEAGRAALARASLVGTARRLLGRPRA